MEGPAIFRTFPSPSFFNMVKPAFPAFSQFVLSLLLQPADSPVLVLQVLCNSPEPRCSGGIFDMRTHLCPHFGFQ